VKLAVTEAVSNVVLHAYREDEVPGSVSVHAQHDDRELRLVIADCGAGYAPRTDSPGLGVGVALIAAIADSAEIRKATPRGTEVHICWSLAA
jgi:anti-sigma regulatory factor (Ser/Thr protein kinase)